jgi:hypothetical protein
MKLNEVRLWQVLISSKLPDAAQRLISSRHSSAESVGKVSPILNFAQGLNSHLRVTGKFEFLVKARPAQ